MMKSWLGRARAASTVDFNSQCGLCQAFTAEVLKRKQFYRIRSARIETEKMELGDCPNHTEKIADLVRDLRKKLHRASFEAGGSRTCSVLQAIRQL
jgi:hypothetical protein